MNELINLIFELQYFKDGILTLTVLDIKLEALVTKTYRSLAVVGKLSQLTEVDRMLTHAMECLPPTHSDQVISLQYMNVQKPPKFQMSRWDVFYQFLKDKKASMQQFSHNVIEDFLLF